MEACRQSRSSLTSKSSIRWPLKCSSSLTSSMTLFIWTASRSQLIRQKPVKTSTKALQWQQPITSNTRASLVHWVTSSNWSTTVSRHKAAKRSATKKTTRKLNSSKCKTWKRFRRQTSTSTRRRSRIILLTKGISWRWKNTNSVRRWQKRKHVRALWLARSRTIYRHVIELSKVNLTPTSRL